MGVLKGLAKFEGRSSLRTWTFTILVNRAKTRGVREARTRTLSWSESSAEDDSAPAVDIRRFQSADGEYPGHWTPAGAPAPWSDQPERRALVGEVFDLVEQALQRLPPRQRLVATLRDVQGMPADEACAVLGISPQNQRVLLHRARSALRGALEEYYRGSTRNRRPSGDDAQVGIIGASTTSRTARTTAGI
jgi:RNA polymerase sigma-70 factor (ECF subfamily)